MPVLSKFYGIVVRMFFVRHLEARFHAIYENSELVVSLWPLRIIQGDAPARVREMVLKWAGHHHAELLAAWDRCRRGMAPLPITPLP